MNQLNNITETQLDILLQEVYLKSNSYKVNETDANIIFGKDYPITIDSKKETELLQKLKNATNQKQTNYWLYAFILFALIIISLIGFLVFASKQSQLNQKSQPTNNNINEETKYKKNENQNTTTTVIINKTTDTFPKKSINTIYNSIADSLVVSENKLNKPLQAVEKQTMPYLKTNDKLNFKNLKEQLLRNIITLNKNFYTKIPANKINYAGKNLIIDGFALRNMAVSNLEYKIFLADLISQNRTADYFKAQVFSENWSKYQCHQIASSYFQNEASNDFPVTNISYDGMKLFCKWLQEEIELYSIQHQIKPTAISIRLPYCEEWICAAKDGYAKISFENGYHTMYDINEGLVDKTFVTRQEKIRQKNARIDSLYNYYNVNHFGTAESSITNILNKGFVYYPMNEPDTLNPSKMKVFNKLYKTSEIVILKNNSNYWLAGQTWKNKEEYQQFEQEFKNNKCSPFVGFRFVIINPNEPEYKNPFW